MRLMIRRLGSRLFGTSDTVGTAGAAADAGSVPHLDAAGRLNGTMTLVYYGTGVPVDYTDGTPPATQEGVAEKGSAYVDLTNGNWYINGGTKAQPIWKLVTRAA